MTKWVNGYNVQSVYSLQLVITLIIIIIALVISTCTLAAVVTVVLTDIASGHDTIQLVKKLRS